MYKALAHLHVMQPDLTLLPPNRDRIVATLILKVILNHEMPCLVSPGYCISMSSSVIEDLTPEHHQAWRSCSRTAAVGSKAGSLVGSRASKDDLQVCLFRLLPIGLMSRVSPTMESMFHCLVATSWPGYVSGRHLASPHLDRDMEIRIGREKKIKAS